jgi:hypothetical protein
MLKKILITICILAITILTAISERMALVVLAISLVTLFLLTKDE